MRRGEFTINGTTSNSLSSHIQFRPEIATPIRKVQRKSIPGVSEDYIFDEEAYENTSIPLQLFVKGEDEEEINYLKDLITYTFDSGDYIEFIPYWDNTMIYHVKTIDGPRYTPNGKIPHVLNYAVELTAKPFKHFRESIGSEGTQSLTLNNPTFYESEPIVTLYGTGDMNLIVNGDQFVFQDIDDYVIVDSETENAYKDVSGRLASRNNRMYTIDFPLLQPGENTIEVTGNATRFKVEPRWRKLVS